MTEKWTDHFCNITVYLCHLHAITNLGVFDSSAKTKPFFLIRSEPIPIVRYSTLQSSENRRPNPPWEGKTKKSNIPSSNASLKWLLPSPAGIAKCSNKKPGLLTNYVNVFILNPFQKAFKIYVCCCLRRLYHHEYDCL